MLNSIPLRVLTNQGLRAARVRTACGADCRSRKQSFEVRQVSKIPTSQALLSSRKPDLFGTSASREPNFAPAYSCRVRFSWEKRSFKGRNCRAMRVLTRSLLRSRRCWISRLLIPSRSLSPRHATEHRVAGLAGIARIVVKEQSDHIARRIEARNGLVGRGEH